MSAIVGDKTELIALASAVDLAMGMPLAGVDVGAGIHGPPEGGVTLRYAELREHPTVKDTWCYPLDEKNRPLILQKQVADGKSVQLDALVGESTLTSDWTKESTLEVLPIPTKSSK